MGVLYTRVYRINTVRYTRLLAWSVMEWYDVETPKNTSWLQYRQVQRTFPPLRSFPVCVQSAVEGVYLVPTNFTAPLETVLHKTTSTYRKGVQQETGEASCCDEIDVAVVQSRCSVYVVQMVLGAGRGCERNSRFSSTLDLFCNRRNGTDQQANQQSHRVPRLWSSDCFLASLDVSLQPYIVCICISSFHIVLFCSETSASVQYTSLYPAQRN